MLDLLALAIKKEMLLDLNFEKTLQRVEGVRQLKVEMSLDQGDFVAIYGPSGIGKTTLLRVVAGLSQVDKGTLYVQKKAWFDTTQKVYLPSHQRKVGFVFQDYALFPNMTVLENLRFANPNIDLIQTLLKETNLEGLKDKKPQQLSGGQQQRVALARALLVESPVLLLDEPLSALDSTLRRDMQTLIATLHQKYNRTVLMVSHDILEIITLANKILVIKEKEAILYNNPKTYFQSIDLLQEIEEIGTIISLEENQVTLQVNEQIRKVQRSMINIKSFHVGDKVKLKQWILPSSIYNLERP